MTIRVAITGYGRIGRNVLRAFYEEKKWPDVKIVAINDTAKPEATVHLTKFDTTHGKFNGDVYWDDGHLVVNGDRIFMCSNVIRRSFLGRSGRRHRSRMHRRIPR